MVARWTAENVQEQAGCACGGPARMTKNERGRTRNA